MSIREELHETAARLHEILQHERDGLSEDELTALQMSMQLLDWASCPPEEVQVIVRKRSITFGATRLGDEFHSHA